MIQFNSVELETILKDTFINQYFTMGQTLLADVKGNNIVFTVMDLSILTLGDVQHPGEETTQGKNNNLTLNAHDCRRGILNSATHVTFQSLPNSSIRIAGGNTTSQSSDIFKPDFNFEKLGIGGLSREFGEIFRRAFAPRVFPPNILSKLGISPIKGILLHGPPGTGKTLMARCIGKMLNGREPKIVNGPEILNKYVGQSEENIRELFADAEEEWSRRGENSSLHIIVMDELDAICKQRGSRAQGGTGVGDSVVNQLLSKMDGYKQIDNILIIGMTNRKDMIDEALLRPGRLEVHMEISLPDEQGRLHILNIHTCQMKQSGYLDPDVDLPKIASATKNFSGADISGLVKCAASYALNRKIDVSNPSKPIDPESIFVLQSDFDAAMTEVKPLFGIDEKDISKNIKNDVIDYGAVISKVLAQCRTFFEQVYNSNRTPLVTVLLEGAVGSGKTALASHIALLSQFPYAKLVTPEDMVGFTEQLKVAQINKVFMDSYRSPLSIIIVDDIERLIEYVRIGPRFSNVVLQALLVLLKKAPPPGKKLLIIGTTSNKMALEDLEFMQSFNAVVTLPNVTGANEVAKVLMHCEYSKEEIESVISQSATLSIPIKKLIMVAEIAKQEPGSLPEKFLQGLLDYGEI